MTIGVLDKNKKAYIAGPFTDISFPRILRNVRRGLRLYSILLMQGYTVYCPFLDYFTTLTLGEGDTIEPKIFQANAKAWLEVCGIIFVLPDWTESKGTQAEVQWSKEHNLDIVYVQETHLKGAAWR